MWVRESEPIAGDADRRAGDGNSPAAGVARTTRRAVPRSPDAVATRPRSPRCVKGRKRSLIQEVGVAVTKRKVAAGGDTEVDVVADRCGGTGGRVPGMPVEAGDAFRGGPSPASARNLVNAVRAKSSRRAAGQCVRPENASDHDRLGDAAGAQASDRAR